MAKKLKSSKQKISDDLKELVIARLDVLPHDKKISIGSSGEFTKEEILDQGCQRVSDLLLTKY